MLRLPKSTEFNKRIPKQKFYENMDISPAIKKLFAEQVKAIYWKNKIATSTLNLEQGNDVAEIEVFEVKLNNRSLDEGVLRQMDRKIPYHILFLLEYQGKYQAWIGYKEAVQSGANAFKVNTYYHIEWIDEEDIPVKLEGLSIDAVYENFVREIAQDTLPQSGNETLEKSVIQAAEKAGLEKKLAGLKKKLKTEKQLNKQVQIDAEIKKVQKELNIIERSI